MIFDVRREADKLFRVIQERPGIKQSELHKYSQSLSPEQRIECLDWLKALNRIREAETRPKRGPAAKAYWPLEGDAPDDPQVNQLAVALSEVDQARRLLVQVTGMLDTAARRLDEMQATAAAPVVAA